MRLDVNEVEDRTREVMSAWKGAEIDFSVIEKGGSGRIFIRAKNCDSGESVIAMHYSDERSDNLRFFDVTEFLNRHGVPSPKMLESELEKNLLWVEDLGEVDLGDLAKQSWEEVRRPAYEAALRAVFQLHAIEERDAPSDLPELEVPFDESLYRWEQEYFMRDFVERFLSKEWADELIEDASLKELAASLAALPRTLLHRDFQSTNVMMRDGEAFLIDYQGLRWGLPEYDLASLIYDPYTEFLDEEREHLITYYFDLVREQKGDQDEEAFRERLAQCAMQRLMQALGAYGFLSEVKGKREFLQHIPAAQARLLAIAQSSRGLSVLVDPLSSAD